MVGAERRCSLSDVCTSPCCSEMFVKTNGRPVWFECGHLAGMFEHCEPASQPVIFLLQEEVRGKQEVPMHVCLWCQDLPLGDCCLIDRSLLPTV